MKNIVLFASLTDDSLSLLKKIKETSLFREACCVHLVHCFEIQTYTAEFSAYTYPAREQYPEFEEGAKNVLKVLQSNLEGAFENLSFKTTILFDSDPKHRMTEYLKEEKADLAVVATRGKHGIEGLFSSSFADHLTRYSSCDVYVLRPKA